MKSVILSTLKNLESQVAALRAALNEIPEVSSVQPKEKRVMSAGVAAWNENVKSVLSQMVAADWKHPVTGKSAIYRDALAEAGRLRGLADPEVAKKQAEQKVKKAEKKAAKAASSSASSVASAPSVAEPPSEKKERKNPWLGLTEEQKAERVAKMAAGKLAKKEAAAAAPSASVAAPVSAAVAAPASVPSASNPFDDAPVSDAESATSSKKRGPPKGVKLSEEERVRRAAKAKATRDAKKVAGAAAVPLPESPPPSSASSVIVDEIDEETFTKQQIGSKIVYKNALGHVRAYTTEGAGIWLGMYDPVKKVIDASVPEPAE
jgi:hypothetical protein